MGKAESTLYPVGVFSKGSVYDQDDREADKVWDDIDDHMDQRRRAPREKRLKEELEEMRKSNPKITETFADLKRDLAETMTQEDWEVYPPSPDPPGMPSGTPANSGRLVGKIQLTI
jgi:pre-mRNA-processing factor 6